MPDGFAVFDSAQCLVMANQAYLGVFRDYPEVGIGKRYTRILEICAYEGLVLSDNHLGRCRQPPWPVGLDGRRACPSGGQPHRPD